MNTQGVSDQKKPGWDKRTWRLAAIFCVIIAGSVIITFDLAIHSDPEKIEATYLFITSTMLSLFICPAVLAAIARRRWLLWAYVPWLAFIASIWVGPSILGLSTPTGPAPVGSMGGFTVSTSGTSIATVWIGFGLIAVLILSPLVSASPVCLYRVFRRRARTTELKRQAAIDEAIHSHREGFWPPPADRGESQ